MIKLLNKLNSLFSSQNENKQALVDLYLADWWAIASRIDEYSQMSIHNYIGFLILSFTHNAIDNQYDPDIMRKIRYKPDSNSDHPTWKVNIQQ